MLPSEAAMVGHAYRGAARLWAAERAADADAQPAREAAN